MATSNVEYYQKQKDLQDKVLEHEQKRKSLEAQLQAYCRSDQKLSKLRAVKLQSYWKKVCEDEKRSKQRNSQLLKDLDRMEANMASLEARREKLRALKQQYFEYIERTYPQWIELVNQTKQQQMQQQQQQYQQQQQFQQQQYQQQQQQMQQQYQQHQYQQQFQQQHQMAQQISPERSDEGEDEAPPLPSQPPPPPAAFRGASDTSQPPENEYTNLKDVQRPSQIYPSSQPSVPSVTVHMPKMEGEVNSPAKHSRPDSGSKTEQPGPSWVPAERDTSIHSVSFSEEIEIPISQPVQSVTVRQKSDPPKPLQPVLASLSDEEVSELDDDPSGVGVLPPGEQQERPISPPSPPSPVNDQEEEEEEEDHPPIHVQPDITADGLLRLLKYVEEELDNSLSVEGFYRSRNPDPSTRKDIIHKANGGMAMGNVDPEYVSMVILEQMTPLLRRLPGACLLSDTVLIGNVESLTESQVKSNLHRDALKLWDKLMDHFVCLVNHRAFGTREVAIMFVPCLVHESSQHQEKAVRLIENIVEGHIAGTNRVVSPTPQDSLTIDTARSSQQGGVPRLKFGSLVDSRQYTDEESSMITQSMNTEGPKVPLNETDAYKNLIEGNRPPQSAGPNVADDDTDNSDNDLEKQFVSTLSPRSHASTIKSVLGSTGGSSQQRKLAGMISSDLDSDNEEVDLGQMGTKKEEDDDDFYDFYG